MIRITRAPWVVLLLAITAYANSLGNGFAMDDEAIVATNPVVTEGRWGEALLGPYWPVAREGAGLYRPVTLGVLSLQSRAWGTRPAGFHLVNVVLHATASMALLALLLRLCAPLPATIGAGLFAIHPVHVEAVANVVGISELLAACAVLFALLLYLEDPSGTGFRRAARFGGLLLLYLVGLGSKEIAVTLPALLVLVECFRPSARPLVDRLRGEAPLYLCLLAVLAGYLLLRSSVLGTFVGEVPAPWLRGDETVERVLTALAAWGHYLRLMVFPIDLVSDYAPGVTRTHPQVDMAVLAGGLALCAFLAVGWIARRRAPMVSLGALWFVIAVLPVSNLLFVTGILLAERVLYLPSVSVAMAGAGVVTWLRPRLSGRVARGVVGIGLLCAVGLLGRTMGRNPTWDSTEAVVSTLVREHPESYVALRARAASLAASGDSLAAVEAYQAARALAPGLYALSVETGALLARLREDERAEVILREATGIRPDQPVAYRLLAEVYLRHGRGREAHATALDGLAKAGPDRELWSLTSEAYILKGDLEASVRARRAALGLDPESARDWRRLAELLTALGREEEAWEAQRRAASTNRGG